MAAFIGLSPPGAAQGIPAAFYFLPSDTREKTPVVVNFILLNSPFYALEYVEHLDQLSFNRDMDPHLGN